ncbi:MAG TPA: hypothetical protein VLH39_08745, partial [Magnetospirillaceae bacterium]|nr:hypothetical protein [Magnetospirillaceae bacterium]
IHTRAVIGSQAFGQHCYRTLRKIPFASPPVWYFSMKYFVNRVYDYICAMRNLGYSLEEVGFDSRGTRGGPDPDYNFLRNAHRLMLYLQELMHLSMKTFGMDCDYSYISRPRFLRFMEVSGQKFRKDFEELVLGGGILPPTGRERFRLLQRKIEERATDRIVLLRAEEREALPEGFVHEVIDRDSAHCRINVPYSWADLGFLVFCIIAARIGQIVDTRLLPSLSRLSASQPGTAASAQPG